ncbi:MAG: isocitrate lyase/PEP mutase family protein [Acidimicrobiales bacterium]
MSAARLRELVDAPGATLLAGCYDGVSARLVEEAGFDAAHMSGFAVAGSLLGQPDVGLLTMTEMADAAARLARVLSIPLLADADTGYGNAINVIRTVEAYIAGGVAGLHLEDQVMPKRCGHLAGKDVIEVDEMAGKLRAAIDARKASASDIVIVARTDARAIEGLDAAIERGRRYRDAGADLLFVEALESPAEIETVATAFADVPLVFNASAARPPEFTMDELGELGFSIVFAPITALLSATRAIQSALAELLARGPTAERLDAMASYDEFLRLVGIDHITTQEDRYR